MQLQSGCAHTSANPAKPSCTQPFAKKEKGKLKTELVDSTPPRRHEPALPRR
jgi:hypothetical protein